MSSKTQEAKIRIDEKYEEVKQLVILGKERGYLGYDEVNDTLPEELSATPDEVDEVFAYDEGEGDRSLVYWRTVHWEAFSRTCAAIGRKPAETMPLICERFRVVFSK